MEQLESRALLAAMSFTIQDNSGLDPSKYAVYAMGSNFTTSKATNWYMDSSLKFINGLYGAAPNYTSPSFKITQGQTISVPDKPALAGVRLYFFVVPVGGVASGTVIDASFGYQGSSIPVLFSSAPTGGVTAQGYAQLVASDDPTLDTNKVGSIVVTNPGSGYTSPPTVTIAPPGVVDTVTVTSGGSGYTNGAASFLVTSQTTGGTAGVQVNVVAGAVQLGGTLVTNRGSGYSPPSPFRQLIAISPGTGGEASVVLKSAATATAALFGSEGPSLPYGTEPTNPPDFPFVSQFVEFTVTAGPNTVDLQTVDGFTLPMTITAGLANVNVVGKQYGQPIATPQQPANAVVTRGAIFDAFTAFMNKQGTAGQPYQSLPYLLDNGLVDGQQGGILSPGLFLAATNATGDYKNLTSPLNTLFKDTLQSLFSPTTKMSVQGVSSGAGGIARQVYAVTYKSKATYPAPAGVTLKSGTGEDITHPALEFKGTVDTFQMFDPAHLSEVSNALVGTISAVSGVFPNQTATLSLSQALPADSFVEKGWFVNGNGLFQGKGDNQLNAISPWYVTSVSSDSKTVELAYTGVNGSVSGTAVTTPTASQYQFSKLPYIAMMLTPGQMAFGNSGVFADNALQYTKGSPAATVLGNLEYQVAAALNRGVLFASGAQGASNGGTSTVWFNDSGWYPLGTTQNLFSLFMHVGQVSGVPIFFQPANAVQIQGQSGPNMGSAYGFPFDETPPGGSQVPSKFDGNIGGSEPGALPIDILVTFGPWGNAAAPTIVSIDTNPPEQGTTPTPTTAQTVTWTVQFTEPVKSVSAANFSLVPGNSLSGTSIQAVTPSGTGQYSQTWTVTANTGTGTGTLGLNLTSVGTIQDQSGHALDLPDGSFTGQVYSVRPNPVGPTATVTIPNGAQNPTDSATVTFNVNFTEVVTGLSAANFALVAGGGVTGATVQTVLGSGTAYTVTVNTGTGSGTLALQLATAAGITPTVTSLPVTSSAYTIDKNAPTNPPDVHSIALAGTNPTAAPSVSWTVTFTEPVTGVTAANFQLVASGLGGTPTITGVTPVSATSTATWIVTASTGSGSGTLGITMMNSTNVHDANSQAVTNLPFTGSVYTIDRTAPALQSITRANQNPTAQPTVSWTVAFSEAVFGVSKANFQLVASGLSGTQITQVSQAGGSGAAWTVTAFTGSGSGTLQLKMVNAAGITDAVGLAPTGIPLAGQSYQVQRGGATIVTAPISFMTTAGRVAKLVWLMRPFSDPDSVRLTAAMAVSPAAGGTLRAISRAGVTVTPSGTPSAELQFSGTVAALNAYFQNRTGFISYTPTAGSLTPRMLTLSAQGSDGLSGLATAAVLVRARAPQAPAPAVRPTALLGPSPAGQPVVISYAQLVAATGATQTTSRSIQFMFAGLSSGRLEVWTGSRWSVVPAVANIPLLAPGGQIRWTPPAGASGIRAAFSVKTWDGWHLSGASRVSVSLTT